VIPCRRGRRGLVLLAAAILERHEPRLLRRAAADARRPPIRSFSIAFRSRTFTGIPRAFPSFSIRDAKTRGVMSFEGVLPSSRTSLSIRTTASAAAVSRAATRPSTPFHGRGLAGTSPRSASAPPYRPSCRSGRRSPRGRDSSEGSRGSPRRSFRSRTNGKSTSTEVSPFFPTVFATERRMPRAFRLRSGPSSRLRRRRAAWRPPRGAGPCRERPRRRSSRGRRRPQRRGAPSGRSRGPGRPLDREGENDERVGGGRFRIETVSSFTGFSSEVLWRRAKSSAAA